MRGMYRRAALGCCALWGAAALAQNCQPNLLTNPGFEQGLSGWRAQGAQADGDTHSGRGSLRYDNADVAQYRTFNQALQVVPGQTIDFGVWLKTRGVRGQSRDGGAGVYLQSFDAQGRFLEGSYPAGVTGDSGWRQVNASYTVPPQAARITFGVYLRKGSTGTAWFDDAYACARASMPALYQLGASAQGKVDTLVVTSQPQHLQVDSELLNAEGQVVHSSRDRYQVEGQRRIEYQPPAGLAQGEYRLRQQVTGPQSRQAQGSELSFRVGQPAAKVAIDSEGFTLRDGQRLFPLGIYANVATDEHLARIASAGFNTVLNYDYGEKKDPYAFFRNARKRGLLVIYSVKDQYRGSRFAPAVRGGDYAALTAWYVQRLRSQPNLLAWYINDELGPEYLDKIEEKNLQIKRLDGDHPTFQVLNKTGELDAHFNSSDILATDPYPVGNDSDLTRTTRYTALTVQAARQARGAWVVMQIMDHAAYDARRKPHPPSEAEIRNQAWQALIGGAKGLLFYSYTDLFYKRKTGRFDQREFDATWRGVAAVSQQIAAFTPYLLTGKSTPLAGSDPQMPARMFILGDRALLLVANPYYREGSTRLRLPAGWRQQGAGAEIALALPAVGTATLWLQR
ncbi:TPA: carbohydrate-binding protein CenC [Serratia marcescens]|nr:carbohydrate-binding CenC domain-containing protein [Serratia marcescens]AGE18681.1 carbohydrate-binding CenC domain-containing protein [Serratia marcescens WW4]MDP8859590.1 carbohydrate-binding protein CenC [Serratia marcescens]MDY7606443.1 carbohydrate-binding protein CenC [Serratia marcescens]UTL87595.1 carbohydrate-binding protein CenC [Serratia marcescens]UYY69183.1 carbohydrate-binding protein CenC [Serratia marcescens]